MPIIQLKTEIHSNPETCFDLARSIDLHKISTAKTNETAIDGVTTGLIGLNEFVTWQAIHFGIRQKLTAKITEFNRPHYFRDVQWKGAFSYFTHDHYFQKQDDRVIMTDVFDFKSPWGVLGWLADQVVLKRYMTQLLVERNEVIREYAESDGWRMVFNLG